MRREFILAEVKNTTRLAAGYKNLPPLRIAAGVISPWGIFGGLHPRDGKLGEPSPVRQVGKLRGNLRLAAVRSTLEPAIVIAGL
jgi:hypothetical protein